MKQFVRELFSHPVYILLLIFLRPAVKRRFRLFRRAEQRALVVADESSSWLSLWWWFSYFSVDKSHRRVRKGSLHRWPTPRRATRRGGRGSWSGRGWWSFAREVTSSRRIVELSFELLVEWKLICSGFPTRLYTGAALPCELLFLSVKIFKYLIHFTGTKINFLVQCLKKLQLLFTRGYTAEIRAKAANYWIS